MAASAKTFTAARQVSRAARRAFAEYFMTEIDGRTMLGRVDDDFQNYRGGSGQCDIPGEPSPPRLILFHVN